MSIRGKWTREVKSPGLWRRQTVVTGSRAVNGYGRDARLFVTVRYDDECGNRHNTFGITGDIVATDAYGRRETVACGCVRDDIAQVFPELAPLIAWNGMTSEGPTHYVANTVYLAGDRDCHVLLAGERRQIRNGRTGEPVWHLEVDDGSPLYLLNRASHEGPTPPAAAPVLAWRPWCRVGEGKPRDLDAARRCAVWPDATDEQLSVPPEELEAALLARAPALVAQFRAALETAGFVWSPETFKGE